jgi:16S rRNA (cytosine967-C5)-methyltransferase
VQDAGSQLLTSWVAPLLGGWILDVCCAPGGKLTHLLELQAAGTGTVAPAGLRLAGMDASRERLRRVRDNVRRLHLEPPPLLVGDAARLPLLACGAARLAGRPGADGSGWSALLLDVPCSATGMIRKYPELKWRKHEEDLAALVAAQARLLDAAAQAVRPGGAIVYVTCSLEPEENELQVDKFLARTAGFRRRRFHEVAPPAGLGIPAADLLTGAGDLQVLPDTDRMGLFAALMGRVAAEGTAGPGVP